MCKITWNDKGNIKYAGFGARRHGFIISDLLMKETFVVAAIVKSWKAKDRKAVVIVQLCSRV